MDSVMAAIHFARNRALLCSSLLVLFLYGSSGSIKSNTILEQSSDIFDDEASSSVPATTLRDYLVPHGEDVEGSLYLAMGPAFFGFYGYFGALAGIEDELSPDLDDGAKVVSSLLVEREIFQGVSGASAGAMAAILLAAGISPHRAIEFVSTLGLSDFADLGGVGGLLKGDKFESIMSNFLQSASPIEASVRHKSIADLCNTTTETHCRYRWPLGLEDSLIPVAVSAVDIQPKVASPEESSWLLSPLRFIASTYVPTEKILKYGSMARAARASACFPGLFQPVGWIDQTRIRSIDNTNTTSVSNTVNDYSLLVDGGIYDWAGYNGLKEIISDHVSYEDDKMIKQPKSKIRLLNMIIGDFLGDPPGPEAVSKSLGVVVDSVLSLSIKGLPKCGPLNMENGVLAIQAARKAIQNAVDDPIIGKSSTVSIGDTSKEGHRHKEQHHFVLEIDASSFVN